jgi:DNA mismatch repair protein MutS
MIPLFYYIGAIDCIHSIQHLLVHQTVEHPYCLTEYKTENKEETDPSIQVEDLWHPYLTESETVKNKIDMKTNILITGPNAAGKSTFIKSMIINILLSQTIGLSSSSRFVLSPFHLLETYLHIPDTKGASSLFEAEMFRSKEYIEKIKNLESSKRSFIVFDEIFSSTNYVEGFSGAYSILKKLSSFSNTLFITTTHYTDLEVLEKDSKERIMNYKFEVSFDADKNIMFHYQLMRGFSNQYIALELLRKNGFDDDILKDALDMCSRIRDKKFLDHSSAPIVKKSKKIKSLKTVEETKTEEKEEVKKKKKVKKSIAKEETNTEKE